MSDTLTASEIKTLAQGNQLRRLAIVFGVIVACLIAAYFVFLNFNYKILYDGLKPEEAAFVVSELDAREIAYKLDDAGATILVPERSADEVRLALAGADAPSKKVVGFELFNDSEMGLTDFAQKIKYLRAIQGELARSILLIDGVEDARVHIALPERAVFRSDDSRPTAAVTVISKPGYELANDKIQGIRKLVAASVADLRVEDVVILNEHGSVLSLEPVDKSSQRQTFTPGETAFRDKSAEIITVLLQPKSFELIMDTTPSVNSEAPSVKRLLVVTQTPLEMSIQQTLRDAIASTVQFSVDRGDRLSFHARQMTSGTVQSEPRSDLNDSAVKQGIRAAPGDTFALPLELEEFLAEKGQLGLIIGTILLVSLTGFFAYRRRGSRKFSKSQYEEFAEVLKLELNAAEGVK